MQFKKTERYPMVANYKRVNRIPLRREWARVLGTGLKPTEFEECFDAITRKMIGMHRAEALELWNVIQQYDVETFVEIGRNMNGGLFLMCCAAQNLKRAESIDDHWYPINDEALIKWANHHNLPVEFTEADSTTVSPIRTGFLAGTYDLVWVDGGHTREVVRADINNWKNNARLIGFHDYSSKERGRWSKHRRYFPHIIEEVDFAARRHHWKRVSKNANSLVIFSTGVK